MGRQVRAAGGVVWRVTDGGAEVAVVHRPRHDDWSLPKGKAIRGEHPLTTACREVVEETGVRPVLGPRLPTQRYRSPGGPKIVHYWAMSGGEGTFTPTAEVDRAAWLPIPEARALLSYRRDVAVLDRVAPALAVDAVVLLVRHTGGPARRRADDQATSHRGRRQARALGRVLPGFAPGRLLSVPDPWHRDTLAPLARHLGLPVAQETALAGDVDRIRELAADGGTSVVAAPGATIRAAVSALRRADRVTRARVRARRGSVWALFFRGSRLTSADYYPSVTDPEA